MTWHGRSGLGVARYGRAWRARLGHLGASGSGKAGPGEARRGKAGVAGHGRVGLVGAWQGGSGSGAARQAMTLRIT
jgi:hypothetical protein